MSEETPTRTRRRTFERARRAAVTGRAAGVRGRRYSAAAWLGRTLFVWVRRLVPFTIAVAPVYALTWAMGRFGSVPGRISFGAFLGAAWLLVGGFLSGPVAAALEDRPFRWGEFFREGTRGMLGSMTVAPALVLAAVLGAALFVAPLIALLLTELLAVPVAAREGLGPWATARRSFALSLRGMPEILVCLGVFFVGPLLLGAFLFLLEFFIAPGFRPFGRGLGLALAFLFPTLFVILPTVIWHELARD